MDLAKFADHVGGEFVAGCLIATVDGRRQYLHKDGGFTQAGRAAYAAWENERPVAIAVEPEVDVAIAAREVEAPRKSHKSMRNRHG